MTLSEASWKQAGSPYYFVRGTKAQMASLQRRGFRITGGLWILPPETPTPSVAKNIARVKSIFGRVGLASYALSMLRFGALYNDKRDDGP